MVIGKMYIKCFEFLKCDVSTLPYYGLMLNNKGSIVVLLKFSMPEYWVFYFFVCFISLLYATLDIRRVAYISFN